MLSTSMIIVLVILCIWELIMKGIALWKAARNSQTPWYVCILIFNTIGILPLVYILFFSNPKGIKKEK
ncbi:MAG: DUF5652 family protein [Candidatus Nanoarchaeia archaeon]|nr:DUF5652 family protein [Candidatus Nanoarchaeia archaeon]